MSLYQPASQSRRSFAWVTWAVLLSVVAAAAFYVWVAGVPGPLQQWFGMDGRRAEPVSPVAQTAAPAPAADEFSATPPAGPLFEYPLPEAQPPAPGKPADPPLPPLDQSDPVIRKALNALPRGGLARLLNLQDHVQRVVVTVDNLPRQIVPRQLSAVQAMPGQMLTQRAADRTLLDERNHRRYDALVGYLESVEPTTLSALYLRFYPLLEQEYRQQGARGRFHDRVIAAIDDMLAAPRPAGPVELVQPRVLYKYADPSLEALSAGQKVMVRVGPRNAERLAVVLRRWRAALIGRSAAATAAGSGAATLQP